MMPDSVKPSECVRYGHSWVFCALAAALFSGYVFAKGGEQLLNLEQLPKNPHGDVAMCSTCHKSNNGGRGSLVFDADVPQLCQSCHDGRHATREAHPVNLMPSVEKAMKIPSDFPLDNGKLTCSTCHDVTWRCSIEQPESVSDHNHLRGGPTSARLEFCFNCHTKQDYQPFNVHDQLESGRQKTETCLWCHISVPDAGSDIRDAASYGLRDKAVELCRNCHSVPAGHPTGDPHMNSKPSAGMMIYMSAYEIRHKMHLPLKQLLKYVQAAKRGPRSIPLDENGNITCYSCHNPHERDLLPGWNPRSVGAEPEKAKNHRLRIREGDIACRACHQK